MDVLAPISLRGSARRRGRGRDDRGSYGSHRTLVARIRLVNQKVKDAHRQLDLLTARMFPAEETEPGQQKQHDVESLASLPGVGRIVLTTPLAEAFDALQRRDYAALRSLPLRRTICWS